MNNNLQIELVQLMTYNTYETSLNEEIINFSYYTIKTENTCPEKNQKIIIETKKTEKTEKPYIYNPYFSKCTE